MGKESSNLTNNPAVSIIYFSPTGTTETILENVADGMGQENPVKLNLTLPDVRQKFDEQFTEINKNTDYWLVGVPVYVGRMPGLVEKLLKKLDGSSKPAIAVAVYGNRAFGISLKQLVEILSSGNFKVTGAGAFIGEHSFSKMFPAAIGRPDEKDIELSRDFGSSVSKKGVNGDIISGDMIKAEISLAEKMSPQKGPVTNVDMDKCGNCNTCVKYCTMGVLDAETMDYKNKKAKHLCLGCMSCVKRCPNEARSFIVPGLMKSVINRVLKKAMTTRSEPYMVY